MIEQGMAFNTEGRVMAATQGFKVSGVVTSFPTRGLYAHRVEIRLKFAAAGDAERV